MKRDLVWKTHIRTNTIWDKRRNRIKLEWCFDMYGISVALVVRCTCKKSNQALEFSTKWDGKWKWMECKKEKEQGA
jgi:hypothetical protein